MGGYVYVFGGLSFGHVLDQATRIASMRGKEGMVLEGNQKFVGLKSQTCTLQTCTGAAFWAARALGMPLGSETRVRIELSEDVFIMAHDVEAWNRCPRHVSSAGRSWIDKKRF